MAKSKQSAAKKEARAPFDLDLFLDKYIWLLIPILMIAYYLYSTGSTGFYQDDEIGHYRNIRQFWGEPFSIMGNQPKPGWKILMVIPGLFGFKGVLIAHCLISALTVLVTYHLGRALKIRNASVGALLLAMQPLWLQLSFRSYSEITAAFFAVLMLYFAAKEKYLWAALASSYIFSIRQEFALVSIGLGIFLLWRKQWLAFVMLAAAPVVLGIIGWLHTGNIMWLLDDMRRIGLGVEVPHKPFWHYFGTYIFIVGPASLALLIVGYFAFLFPMKSWKENLTRYGFLYFTFTSMFAWGVISAWDALNFGANPGHWRYLLSISPLAAVFAVIGYNQLVEKARLKYGYLLLAIAAFITLVFLSRTSNGLTLNVGSEYTKLLVIVGITGLTALCMNVKAINQTVFAVVLLIGASVYTLATEKPRTLDNEASTVKQAAEWYSAEKQYAARPLLANHVLLRYFSDIDINDRNRDIPLQKKTLDEAALGSICVWDSHYGYSQFGGDVPQEYFDNNPRFKFIRQFIAPDQRFGILVFEKVAN